MRSSTSCCPVSVGPLPDNAGRARTVAVPFARVQGWIARYETSHGGTEWSCSPDLVTGRSADGTRVAVVVPFAPLTDMSLDGLVEHLHRPWQVGVLLVRRGGFAVARLVGSEVADSKVGRRHVQGRSKAGGWSQQRFARRRENQARAAFDAAAEHAARILGRAAPQLDLVATGGDRKAVEVVLSHDALAVLRARPQSWLGGVPDPKREVLMRAIGDTRSVRIEITDPSPEEAAQ